MGYVFRYVVNSNSIKVLKKWSVYYQNKHWNLLLQTIEGNKMFKFITKENSEFNVQSDYFVQNVHKMKSKFKFCDAGHCKINVLF